MKFRIQIKEAPKRRATNVLKEQQGIAVLKYGKWYCNVNDELIEIDATNSKIYDFENGILYEKIDGKRGKEITRIKKNRVKI